MSDDVITILENLTGQLAPIANDLHENIKALTDEVETVDQKLKKAEVIEEVVKLLNRACDVITKIHRAFSDPDEHGNTFIKMLNDRFEVGTIGIVEDDFETLLRLEAERLTQIGLNEVVVDLVLEQMKESMDELIAPQPMERAENILWMIDTTREKICEIANRGQNFVKFSSISQMRAAAGCVINVCVVTGDALSPFVVPDPTLKTYVIAVKSVSSGCKNLKKHGKVLLEGIIAFKLSTFRKFTKRKK